MLSEAEGGSLRRSRNISRGAYAVAYERSPRDSSTPPSATADGSARNDRQKGRSAAPRGGVGG